MKEIKDDLFKQIQKDNEYYKSIIENNSFYIIKTDLEGNYTYLNPFFCQMLHLKAEDWIGKPSIELIIPEDHKACIDTIEQCFAHPGISHWVILRKPVYSGTISTQWEFKLLTDEIGNPTEVICIGHDITPMILKQQELQSLVDVTAEQNTRLVNFTYIISHNIRSHVANIIGIINLNEVGNEEDQKMTWDLIKESTKGLDETIKNLSDIISIQSNTSLPVSKVFILKEIEMLMQSIQVLITDANTTARFALNEEEHLLTNPSYFESIMLNLFTNAIKYKSPDRPLEIDISLHTEGRYKVLIFKDNGLGIDLEKHGHHIFGMYKTFHGNTDAKGLGLFIIKTQIEAMNGKIEVESEVNESTTFKIYFS